MSCKYIKKEGASCSLNNKCKYPECEKICTNCGCPNPKKTYDGYWCEWCETEL